MNGLQTLQIVVLSITAVASVGGLAFVMRGYASLADSVKELSREQRLHHDRIFRLEIEHGANHEGGVPVQVGNFNSGPVAAR